MLVRSKKLTRNLAAIEGFTMEAGYLNRVPEARQTFELQTAGLGFVVVVVLPRKPWDLNPEPARCQLFST